MANDLTHFLVAQLAAAGIETRGADDNSPDFWAYCFNGHDSKAPSLHIRKADGMFYCFGCGVKGPNWNVLAQHIGGERLRDQDLPDPFGLLNQHLKRHIAKATTRQQLPWGLEPWDEGARYRGLSYGFLKNAQAHRWYDTGKNCPRVLFPIVQKHELLGWVARRIDDGQEMKYRNSTDMRTTEALFPFDFVRRVFRRPKSVVLVEGPMDALRLCHFRIPALAIMGTNNWRPVKRNILASAQIERIVICTDGDVSGLKCRYETLEPSLLEGNGVREDEQMFDIKHYLPPDGEDPGSMSRPRVEELRKLL